MNARVAGEMITTGKYSSGALPAKAGDDALHIAIASELTSRNCAKCAFPKKFGKAHFAQLRTPF